MTATVRKFADNHGVRIAYQIVGTGSDLVLHHGFSRSGDRWRQQGYVDQLSLDHRLILIDARGHGGSDKPDDTASYELSHRCADVLAVLDAEGIDAAHHWGYSMGGQVCFRLAVEAPGRVRSIVVGGMHPYARDAKPLTRRINALQMKGVAGFTGLFKREFGESTVTERAQLDRNDPIALAAATTAIRDDPGLTDCHLSAVSVPTLMYCGQLDLQFLEGARKAAGMIGADFVVIPDCDHMSAQNPDRVLPFVVPFLMSLDC